MPGPTVTRAVGQVDLVDLVHPLDVDEDAAAQRDRAVVQAGAAGPRDDRDPRAVGQLDDLRHLLAPCAAAPPRRACARPTGAPGTARAPGRG